MFIILYTSVMVCVNNLVRNSANVVKDIRFDTSKNFSSIYHSMLDKSYDTFTSTEKAAKRKTNPILDAIKEAVPIIKPPRAKIAESLHDMIVDITKVPTLAMGKDAMVFAIPKHPDLVLRVEKTALDKMGGLSKDLELVPLSFDKEISSNKHLGLPLYFVTSKSSTIAKKNTISPLEAMAQPDKIMVLRKVTGEHPSAECGDKLMSMMGFEDFANPDPNALNNFSFIFGYVQDNFGAKAVTKAMEYFKSGAKEIPAHALAEGSAPFEIVKGPEFYKKYQDYAESYIKSLKEISEFPQKSYDEAVKFIAREKNFNVDFQHTNNTFVDLEKKEFNFMDFAYDKKDPKYIYENPVKEFKNVLFGKGCRRIDDLKSAVRYLPNFHYPTVFVVTPEYIEKVIKYAKTIHDKVNLASPEAFKTDRVFG